MREALPQREQVAALDPVRKQEKEDRHHAAADPAKPAVAQHKVVCRVVYEGQRRGIFAAGNSVGILVERRLAMGTSVVRILSKTHGEEIAEAVRNDGRDVTIFSGEGAAGPITQVCAVAPRRHAHRMLQHGPSIDPALLSVS